MKSFKNVIDKFPPEVKDGVIELYDFFREEFGIKREEFEKLKEVIEKLIFAQQKTEERLNQLTERVNQLTERVNQLAIAQQKTEERLNQLTERVNQLAIAQQKTEVEIKNLTITVKRIQKDLGGLSHSVGFDLENRAYKALPHLLKEKFGIKVEDRLLRQFIEYPDGKEEELNIFGKARKNGKIIYIIGESKTHLSVKDIDKFKRRLLRIEKVIKEEKFPIFVVHSASPRIVKYAEENGFSVFFSYEFY